MTNCPNCGAVITGPQCEYCDTRFDINPVLYTPKKIVDQTDQYLDKAVHKKLKGKQQYLKRRLEIENELLRQKTNCLADSAAIKELYESALKAMRSYSGTY